MLAKFKSPLHGSAELYDDKIIIRKKTSTTPLIGKSEKTIYLRQLAGVMVKKGGLSSGHIHFATGGAESKRGFSKNIKSDSSIVFGAQLNGDALRFKQAIENQVSKINSYGIPSHSVPSPADEITKFKSLLDQGVITQDEFDEKKRKLLGT